MKMTFSSAEEHKTFHETRWKTQRWMNCSVTGPQERDIFWFQDTYYHLMEAEPARPPGCSEHEGNWRAQT